MTWPDRFWVVGTDTDVGKTIISAALTASLDYHYFKPVQSGCKTDSDSRTVCELTGIDEKRIIPEVYRLSEPLSPHRAAELDGINIDIKRISSAISNIPSPTVIEAAGGLMVPVTRKTMQIEVIQASKLPVVLVTRTSLGTINHTLLSIMALREFGISLHSLIFNGEDNPDNIRTISENLEENVQIFYFPIVENLQSDILLTIARKTFL